MKNHESNILTQKLKLTSWALCVAILFIACRLVQLQIIQQNNFYKKSQKNFLRVETIAPLRGNILDCNDQLLATNRPTTNIFWQGTGLQRLNTCQESALATLEIILNKPLLGDPKIAEQLKYAERRHQKIVLASDISFEQLSQIAEQLSDQKNILVSTHFKRYYPYKSVACHMLGYLTRMDMDIFGKMGLEKIFEDTLKGEHGQMLKTINSFGRNLAETEVKKACAGQNIRTTLDINIQTIIEKVFPEDAVGTFIVMDPHDGSIVGLLSRPNFDPALFLEPIQEEDWRSLQDKQPFLNRAFNACYPPGSIFKLITVSAMLENGIISEDSCWNCKGFVEFAGRQYFCNNHQGHGYLNVEQSLAHSCNVMFFETAKKINIDLFADYAHRFGLGKKTNIVFAEKEGLIPTAAWKKRVKHEKWWPGDTLSVAIGQSYLLVTPVQIASMISSIFTGYLVTPRILLQEPISKQPLNIKVETRRFLQQSMQKVVNQGTGQRVKRIKDIKIYAKTSTAQTSSLDKEDQGTQFLAHGWFASYMVYNNERPLTFVVLVEHVNTSRIAAGFAAQFLSEYKKMIDAKC